MQEEDLILVVNFCLGKSLVTLITHVRQTLIKAHFLRVIEPFQISELLLRVLVNLIDRVLKLTLLFFKLFFQVSDLLLKSLLRLLKRTLVLLVLLLAKGQVLVSLFFCLTKSLPQALYFLLEILSSYSELELGLGEVLCKGADCCLTFLNLAHVGFSQG